MNARREENLARNGEHVFIDYAFVRPEARSQGIGAALLQRVEEWSRAADIGAIHLAVMAANQEGARFWERAGFAVFLNTMSKPVKPRD
jgi:GNAT superfamily N-acetyltransferase